MLDLTKLYLLRQELNEAIRSKDLKKLSYLLTANERVNLNYLDSTDGQTPLHKSCTTGCLTITKLLVEYGACKSIQNSEGWFPIHLASFYGHMDVVMFFLSLDKRKLSNQSTSMLEKSDEVSFEEAEQSSVDEVNEMHHKFTLFNLD